MSRNGARNGRRRGFTLMEVMLVVAIIGMLAVFIVPRLFGTQETAKIRLTKAAVDSGLNHAISTFRLNHGMLPLQLVDLVEKPEEDAGGRDDDEGGGYQDLDLWQASLDKKDLKDQWGSEYGYRTGEDLEFRKDYELWSFGPDRQDGTDDDIVNWEKDKE